MRLFGPGRMTEDVVGVWRKLPNKELKNMQFSPNVEMNSRRIR
jgi:hypothetical protein